MTLGSLSFPFEIMSDCDDAAQAAYARRCDNRRHLLAALLLIVALFGTIVGLGTAISGPAGTWVAKLPEGIPRLQERLI